MAAFGELIPLYLTACSVEGKTERTVQSYAETLRQFTTAVIQLDLPTEVAEFLPAHVYLFLGWVKDRGVTLGTQHRRQREVKAFFRPDREMAAYCQANDVQLLAYGTLAGGLLSERYLGSPELDRGQLNPASLQKYKQMIDLWGGWSLFQELLAVLKRIADQSNVSIANVAVRYVLDRPAVAGVIVGVRLGVSSNLAENKPVFGLSLSREDVDAIDGVLARGRDLLQLIGDCGDEYRR